MFSSVGCICIQLLSVGNDYTGYNRGGGHRSYRGNSRHFHNNYENCSNNTYHQDGHVKNPSEKRTVVATDKSIRVTLNQGNMAKGPVMSVKGILEATVIYFRM